MAKSKGMAQLVSYHRLPKRGVRPRIVSRPQIDIGPGREDAFGARGRYTAAAGGWVIRAEHRRLNQDAVSISNGATTARRLLNLQIESPLGELIPPRVDGRLGVLGETDRTDYGDGQSVHRRSWEISVEVFFPRWQTAYSVNTLLNSVKTQKPILEAEADFAGKDWPLAPLTCQKRSWPYRMFTDSNASITVSAHAHNIAIAEDVPSIATNHDTASFAVNGP